MDETKNLKSADRSQEPQPPWRNASEIGVVDRGLVAWFQCLGSFCLFFSSWGITNSFGVFQSFYEQSLLSHSSSSRISWIGSTQAFLLIFGGIIVGPAYDRGHLQILIVTGSFLVVFGMAMTSIASEYWEIMLAQGVAVGMGGGCLFVPSVAVLPAYFVRRRALAMGLAAAGVSLGGLIFPIIFRQLQPQIGFGWTTRIIALIMMVTLLFPIITMRARIKPSASARQLDVAAWKEPPFALFAAGTFLAFVGLYIPYFYTQLYGVEKTAAEHDVAFYLLSMLNAGSLVGRIIPNYIADRIGALNSMILCSVSATVLGFCWIPISSLASLIVFAILYGFFSGGFISLGPTVVVSLSPSLDVVGNRMGLLFGPCSIGLLIGNPIAGEILGDGWLNLQAFCGAMIAVATASLLGARITKGGMNLKAIL